MDHAGQVDALDERAQRRAVRDVTRGDLDLGAQLHQPGHEVRAATAAAGQDQLAYAVPSHDVLGEQATQQTRATRDQDRALGAHRGRHREHVLADVLRLADVPERVRRVADVPRAHR
ncbi:hypothetical protein GCM10010435_23990 [Winogradskya consettensis]